MSFTKKKEQMKNVRVNVKLLKSDEIEKLKKNANENLAPKIQKPNHVKSKSIGNGAHSFRSPMPKLISKREEVKVNSNPVASHPSGSKNVTAGKSNDVKHDQVPKRKPEMTEGFRDLHSVSS